MAEEPRRRRTLLERYDIPISHLDFNYVKQCVNVKKLERIYAILKSGEEGHFPDLTKCTKECLIKLCPSSKQLRVEEPLLTKAMMNQHEWDNVSGSVTDWMTEIKQKDKAVRSNIDQDPIDSNVPPIRKILSNNMNESHTNTAKTQRIKSTDYVKWDKYDADTEVLKMDLDVECAREKAEIETKTKSKKNLIEPIQSNILNRLTKIEREKLADEHRIKGNDFFKAGELKNAIAEYTRCIEINPTAIGFCNRAAAHLKLYNNELTISDCDECLKMDPKNIKAHLRKAQALLNNDKYRDAYKVFVDASKIDPTNKIALEQINELRKKISDLPPPNAFRMNITEDNGNADDEKLKNENRQIKEQSKSKSINKKTLSFRTDTNLSDDDFSKLIIPNKIVKSKLASVTTALENLKYDAQKEFQKNLKNAKETHNASKKITLDTVKKRTVYDNGVVIEEL